MPEAVVHGLSLEAEERLLYKAMFENVSVSD
jgi:hypothetical protein